MIKHIVMWNVRGDDAATRARNAAWVKAEFESLRGRVPGLLHLEVGIDESRIDYACDVVLYTEFESRAALAAYAEHPEHLRVRRTLGDVRSARHQVDYEPEPAPEHVHEAPATDRARTAATAAPTTPGDNHVQAV